MHKDNLKMVAFALFWLAVVALSCVYPFAAAFVVGSAVVAALAYANREVLIEAWKTRRARA